MDPSFGNASGSANQGMVGKSTAAQAANPKKGFITKKSDMYPTQANGYDSGIPIVYPEQVTADFYRYGKFEEGKKTYEIPPRTFEPFDLKVPASIRIFGKDVKSDKFKDYIPAYTKFILESVQESHTERSQIVETFGDFYVFMFGERPPMYSFSGQLVNSENANWVTDFMYMYDRYLRGTKCVELNASAVLTYGGRQVEGLILSVATATNAAVEGAVNFNLSMVVFERNFFNFSADMGYATTDQANLLEDDSFLDMLDRIAGPTGAGSSDPEVDAANQEARKLMNGDTGASGIMPSSAVTAIA